MTNGPGRHIATDDTARQWRVGVAASPSLRRGPASPLAQLMREIEPCLRYLGAQIYALQGALHTIMRCGLLRTIPSVNIHGMPPGRLGGLVDIGAAVVERRVVGVGRVFGDKTDEVAGPLGLDTKIDVMVYLLDPYNQTARLPETLALKRECVVKGKPFLATAASAREWFSLHALNAAVIDETSEADALRRFFIHDDDADRMRLIPRGHQTVALIAHNDRKLALAMFAKQHKVFLDGFQHRFGTGTSAGVLNRVCDGEEECPSSLADMDILVKRIRTAQSGARDAERDGSAAAVPPLPARPWVEQLDSGPEGGDLQAAEAILMGVCDTAVFFEDPSSAHEHDADIEVFERAAQVWNLPERRFDGWGVTCLHDPASADIWARLWKAYGCTPTTMTHAFRSRYGVDLVVIDSPDDNDPAVTWDAVVGEAAWYLMSAIMSAGLSCASAGDTKTGASRKLRVVVPPGRGMDDVIREMKHLVDVPLADTKARNAELDRTLKDVRRMLGRRANAERLLGRAESFLDRKRLTDPEQVSVLSGLLVVAPSTGTFGSPVRGIEANAHADELAAIFEAQAVSCAPTAFRTVRTDRLEARSDKPDRPYELHWDASDLLVLTCDAADEDYLSDRGRVPMPDNLGDEMRYKHAVGHVAGLFVDSNGQPVDSIYYDRCGITADRMKKVAEAARKGNGDPNAGFAGDKDSILVATRDVEGRRLATIMAVLEGRYASTLVTDTATACDVLRLTEPKRRGSGR